MSTTASLVLQYIQVVNRIYYTQNTVQKKPHLFVFMATLSVPYLHFKIQGKQRLLN